MGFALLIGLLAGVVLAAVAGARRTETAYARYLDRAHAEDVVISEFGRSNPQYQEILDAVAALSSVEEVATTVPLLALPHDREIRLRDFEAGVDDTFLYGVDRPKMVAGRLPDPDRPDEVFVNRVAARQLGLHVGDELELRALTTDEYYAGGVADESLGEWRRFTVTGVGILPSEVVPIAPFDGSAAVVFTPAYLRDHPGEESDYSYLHIRLRDGPDAVPEFRRQLQGVLESTGIPVQIVPFVDAGARQAKVERSIRPQARALLLFGALLAVVGVIVVGQLLARHLVLDEGQRRFLWGLGYTRRQLLAVTALRLLVLLAGAAAVAVAVAVALSGQFPIGPAEFAEPDPGLALDVPVLVLGAFAIVAVFLAIGCVAVRRSLPRAGTGLAGPTPVGATRPSRLAGLLTEAGAPAAAVVGVRMALERGRGRTAVPVVGAVVATALALGALTAATTFGVNLQRLVTTPSLYGLAWDHGVGNGFFDMPVAQARPLLDGDPDVVAWSSTDLGELSLAAGGRRLSVPAVGVDLFGSDVHPRVLRGRIVARSDEIVLGEATAEALGVDVGDRVTTVDLSGQEQRLRVVGTAVFPGLGRAVFDSTDLAEGAVVRAALLEDRAVGSGRHSMYLVRYRDGVDQDAAAERLRAGFQAINSDCQFRLCVVRDFTPAGIRNYRRVRSTPLLLSAALAVLALATLAITLVTSVRRRRRDFAILESVGFVRRQVAATTAWQATTVAVIALLAGVPLGVAGGRVLWTMFSDQIGVSVPPVTPTAYLVLVVPVTILTANLIAVVPGRLAARTSAARVLRSE